MDAPARSASCPDIDALYVEYYSLRSNLRQTWTHAQRFARNWGLQRLAPYRYLVTATLRRLRHLLPA